MPIIIHVLGGPVLIAALPEQLPGCPCRHGTSLTIVHSPFVAALMGPLDTTYVYLNTHSSCHNTAALHEQVPLLFVDTAHANDMEVFVVGFDGASA
jgi:hypothetical protein